MIDKIAGALLEVIDQIGNIRLDAVTLGMAFEDETEEPVAIIVVARGYYERARVVNLLNDEQEMDLFSIDDIEVATMTNEWDEQTVLMMPSDERFIFMFADDRRGEGGVSLPIDETAMLIQDGETELSLGGVLLDELEQIDRENTPVWMAMEVPAMLKQNEPGEVFGAFDAIHAMGEVADDGKLVVSAVARGEDAGAVAQTVDVIRGYIGEGIAELQEIKREDPAMAPMFDPMLGMLESIELSAEGTTATGTMTIPNAQGGFFSMWFMGM